MLNFIFIFYLSWNFSYSKDRISTLFYMCDGHNSSFVMVYIFVLKTIYFILQNIFWNLHTLSSVVHIKSAVNIQIIKGLLQCYSINKNIFKCLKVFKTFKHLKVFKCVFNDTVTLQQSFYYLNIYSNFNVYNWRWSM